jgi:imidazolonepropionase-like amidohydrolase
MRVAAHAIGAEGIHAAVEAGVDSIEHGCFLRDDSIEAMIAKPAWLVATLSAPEQIVRGSGAPDYAVRKSEEVMPAHHDSFRRAASAGVRIASGTDAGTPFNPHGALSLELKLMHDLGLPPDRVLSAATREAAQLLGVGDVGTVEDEKVADLVLLDADPLDDVGAYAKVSLVVQAGRIVVDRR